MTAQAQTSSDYKALVCIFLFGGNDANNLLIPNETASYANYSKIRQNLAIPQASLVSIHDAASSTTYGLHPSLAPIAPLYNTNQAPGPHDERGHAVAAGAARIERPAATQLRASAAEPLFALRPAGRNGRTRRRKAAVPPDGRAAWRIGSPRRPGASCRRPSRSRATPCSWSGRPRSLRQSRPRISDWSRRPPIRDRPRCRVCSAFQ